MFPFFVSSSVVDNYACPIPLHSVPTYFETLGERSQELDFDGQANEGSHAAVRNGGCEGHSHCALGVAHLDEGGLSEVLGPFQPRVPLLPLLLGASRLTSMGLSFLIHKMATTTAPIPTPQERSPELRE